MRHHHNHEHRCGERGMRGRRSEERGFEGREFGGREFAGRGAGHGPGFEDGFGPRGGFGGPGGFGGGRGGRRRVFDGDALRLLLLRLIADEPRHGYELIRAIEELAGGAYAPSPGVVYPTLSLLAEMGLIAETEAEGSRKRFAITEEGKAHLAENGEAADAALARLAALAGPADRIDPAPVKRAMANLGNVLQARLREEGVGKDRLLDIAALIDEAASKIERL